MKKPINISLSQEDYEAIQVKMVQNSDDTIFVRLANLCSAMSCEMERLFLDHQQSPPEQIEQLFATLQLYCEFVIKKMGLSEENIHSHLSKAYLTMYLNMDTENEADTACEADIEKFTSVMCKAQETISQGEKAIDTYRKNLEVSNVLSKQMLTGMRFSKTPYNSPEEVFASKIPYEITDMEDNTATLIPEHTDNDSNNIQNQELENLEDEEGE